MIVVSLAQCQNPVRIVVNNRQLRNRLCEGSSKADFFDDFRRLLFTQHHWSGSPWWLLTAATSLKRLFLSSVSWFEQPKPCGIAIYNVLAYARLSPNVAGASFSYSHCNPSILNYVAMPIAYAYMWKKNNAKTTKFSKGVSDKNLHTGRDTC